MNKVTVTKSQMEAIERQRDGCVISLENVIKTSMHNKFFGFSKPINLMSEEQIVLAWHGYAEIEKEYVSFYEALKAFEKGEKIIVYHKSGKTSWFSKILDQTEREASPSFHEMINLKWSIVGDNQ